MKKNFAILLALVVVMASSCTMYEEVEMLGVSNVKVTEFSQDGISAEVEMQFKNPNWYNVKIIKSDINLAVNDKPMGRMELGDKVKIPKNSVSYETIKIDSQFDTESGGFLQKLLSLLFHPEVKFEADGYVKARGFIFTKKIPVHFEQDVSRENLNVK